VPSVPDGSDPAWHLYVVTHPRADEVIAALNGAGVQARGYYRRPLHLQPAMAPYVSGLAPLPATAELGATGIALPISPVFGPEQAAEVVAALAGAA
jgi:dTDP-4-amino-4,6-dideoxygalactose transaminase